MKFQWFLGTFSLFIWTSEGSIKTRNPVFVYSLTNIDDQTLQNLVNSFDPNKLPLLEDGYGLRTNITIIPSANPDNYVTIRTIDLPKYSKDYFIDLFKQYNASGDASATFKGLLKATQICSDDSKIVMYSNTKLRDENLLREIVTLWIDKNLEIDSSFKAFSPELANSLEFKIIDQIEEDKNYMKHYTDVDSQLKKCRNSGEPSVEVEDLQNNENSIVAFIYDMINVTNDDLEDISQKMAKYYAKRSRKMSHLRIYNSCHPDYLSKVPTHGGDLSADDFQRLIPGIKEKTSCNTTLDVLIKAALNTRRNQKIIYFSDNEPTDSYDVLPKLADELQRYKTEVIFHTYGDLSKKPLPQIYQIIANVYKYVDNNEAFY